MIEFGMPTLIENQTLQDNINLCSRLGLRFIELNMNFPEYQTEELERTVLPLEVAEPEERTVDPEELEHLTGNRMGSKEMREAAEEMIRREDETGGRKGGTRG